MKYGIWIFTLLILAYPALSPALADPPGMIEIGAADSPTSAERVAIVILPDAFAQMTENPGDSNWGALDLQLGNFAGLRAQLFLRDSGGVSPALEIFVGGSLSAAGFGNTFGGGVHLPLTAISDRQNDALEVSPGVDLYVLLHDARNEEFNTPQQSVYFIATNLDVTWVHQMASHFGWELGARLGAATPISGVLNNGERAAGHVVPELGIFTGLRI
jgi:hypothetical protein